MGAGAELVGGAVGERDVGLGAGLPDQVDELGGDEGAVALVDEVGLAGPDGVGVHARLAPLTSVEPDVPQVTLVGRGVRPSGGAAGVPVLGGAPEPEVDPGPHRRVLATEEIDVAVGLPQLVGHEHGRVAPPRRAGQEAVDSHFWTLQAWETAGFLTLAATTFWWIRHRTP